MFQIVISVKNHRHKKSQFDFHLDFTNWIADKKLKLQPHFRNKKRYVVQEYNLNSQNLNNDNDLVWEYYHCVDIVVTLKRFRIKSVKNNCDSKKFPDIHPHSQKSP